MTVKARELRRLLGSELPDPTLILVEGRLEIVPVDALDADPYRGALLLLSRSELHARGVDESSTDDELEHQAAMISTAVTDLGA